MKKSLLLGAAIAAVCLGAASKAFADTISTLSDSAVGGAVVQHSNTGICFLTDPVTCEPTVDTISHGAKIVGPVTDALLPMLQGPLADVVIPTGSWFGSVATFMVAVVPTLLLGILKLELNRRFKIKLDDHYDNYIKDLGTLAFQAVKNALQEKVPDTVVIPTSSQYVTDGAKWIIETETPQLVNWFGGQAGIEKWLNSQINVLPADPAAS